MKILFIARPDSVHVGRWIEQIKHEGWDLHFYPWLHLSDEYVHSTIQNVTFHHFVYGGKPSHPSVKRKGIGIPSFIPKSKIISKGIRQLAHLAFPSLHKNILARVINRVKPDIIHIIELQHAGYLFLEAMPLIKIPMPKIIITNFGSDIFLFGRLEEHKQRIRQLVEMADYYKCECERDIGLAEEMGLKGKSWPVYPNTGGHDLEQCQSFRHPIASERRYIMLKGYQNIFGRSLFALKALEQVAELLKGYTVVLFSYGEDVEIAAKLFSLNTGIPVKYLQGVSHEEMLEHFGNARIYLHSSISDGLSTSMGEAIAMGAFPIQTCTACADEWLVDGETGIIIRDPEDTNEIAAALKRALTDDDLVNHAAEHNWQVAQERLDANKITALTIQMYRSIFEDIHAG